MNDFPEDLDLHARFAQVDAIAVPEGDLPGLQHRVRSRVLRQRVVALAVVVLLVATGTAVASAAIGDGPKQVVTADDPDGTTSTTSAAATTTTTTIDLTGSWEAGNRSLVGDASVQGYVLAGEVDAVFDGYADLVEALGVDGTAAVPEALRDASKVVHAVEVHDGDGRQFGWWTGSEVVSDAAYPALLAEARAVYVEAGLGDLLGAP